MTRVYGLTGGIASGKSLVADILRELGAPVIDADALARQVVEPGQPAYLDLVRELGPGILGADGAIDRKRLADIVFADEDKRRRLNAITHPRIAQLAQAETARYVARGEPVVFYEAALLVESGINGLLDGLVVVSAPEDEQLRRAMARDGQGEAAARARMAVQLPLAKKLEVATHVIDNSGSIAETRAQVERLWKSLSQR